MFAHVSSMSPAYAHTRLVIAMPILFEGSNCSSGGDPIMKVQYPHNHRYWLESRKNTVNWVEIQC